MRVPLDRQEVLDPRRAPPARASTTSGWSSATAGNGPVGQVVADRVRQHEVAVGQALHERRGAEPVGAVVGEVRLAGHEQAGDRGLQVVVDPEPAHRVVDGRVDPHRRLVRVLAGDPLRTCRRGCRTCPRRPRARAARWRRRSRGRRPEPARARRRGPRRRRSWPPARRCRGARGCRTTGRSAPGSSRGPPRGSARGSLSQSAASLRHPDPAVVAQRLAHQGELGLVLAGDRDARRVDLRVAGVAEVGALAVRPPGRGDVAAHRVGRQEEDVAVAAGGQHDGVREVGLDLAGDHVADDDAAGPAVDDDQLEHLVPGDTSRRCRRRSAAPAPGRRRSAAAGRSGRGRRRCGRPARRRRSGCRAGRRTRGRTARPGRRTGR